MERTIILFVIAVTAGLGAADYQVRDFRDASAQIDVYGWRSRDKAVDIVWMGETYPALSWDQNGNIIIEAGGLGYDLTDGGAAVVRAAKIGYEKGADLLQSLWGE